MVVVNTSVSKDIAKCVKKGGQQTTNDELSGYKIVIEVSPTFLVYCLSMLLVS